MIPGCLPAHIPRTDHWSLRWTSVVLPLPRPSLHPLQDTQWLGTGKQLEPLRTWYLLGILLCTTRDAGEHRLWAFSEWTYRAHLDCVGPVFSSPSLGFDDIMGRLGKARLSLTLASSSTEEEGGPKHDQIGKRKQWPPFSPRTKLSF